MLFSGREHVLNLDRRFDITRDGMPQATILRRLIGRPRIALTATDYLFKIKRITGEKFEARGMFTNRWTLTQGDALIAAVETDGEVSEITLPAQPRDLPFVMTVIMAIIRLNPPAKASDPTDY